MSRSGRGSNALLSVDVENLDDLLERVEAFGGRVLGPPNNMAWGQRAAHIEDPDGNAINLTRPI
jgi:predicted enzyme related to lactoylglutathione lyase